MTTKKRQAKRVRSSKERTVTSKMWRKSTRYALYARGGWRCVWCGTFGAVVDADGVVGAGLSLDHSKPWSHGGGNGEDNVFCSCDSCNSKRGDKTVAEFAREIAKDEQEYQAIVRRVRAQLRRSLSRWRALGRSIEALRVQMRQAERRGDVREAVACRRAIAELLEAAGLPAKLEA